MNVVKKRIEQKDLIWVTLDVAMYGAAYAPRIAPSTV